MMMTDTFRTSAARLILTMIKTGEELRNDLGPNEAELLETLEETSLGDSIGAVRYMPEEERLDLLSDMWMLAANDDEMVEDADLFILSAAEALDLPISTVEIVRPANFAKLASDAEKTAVNG